MAELGKAAKNVYESMIGAYQNTKDKKQAARDALAIFEENVDLIEASRTNLRDIDNLVDLLRESLNIISERKNKKAQIRKGSIVSKLVPCGKNCNVALMVHISTKSQDGTESLFGNTLAARQSLKLTQRLLLMSWAVELINNKRSKRRLFPNVKNKRLLELGALYFAFYYDHNIEPAKSIIKRCHEKGHYPNSSGIAFELQVSDIVAVLNCSERKAKEYITILRTHALINYFSIVKLRHMAKLISKS